MSQFSYFLRIHFIESSSKTNLMKKMSSISKKKILSFQLKGESQSNVLLKTQLTTMPLAECNAKLLELFRFEESLRDGLSQGQYCTYDPRNISDSCKGDSGGPVQYLKSPRIPMVVGVISFGFGCGNGLPSINTRVAYYLDWIESVVWPNGFTLPEFF